ncbi:MAG: FAD:protein FMN transferase [Candidatus Delongbacteria bacterium]|nr:FAD:protein FMN transferase [Candidatus Delongbacteria bacterium]MBN2835580.1 FAD:protein FMN transferase [Candidatus Delongbacteria bacterium]
MLRLLVFFILFFLISCTDVEEKFKYKADFIEFSTKVNITLYDVPTSGKNDVENAISQVREIFAYYDTLMNPGKEYSVLYKFNRKEPGKFYKIPEGMRNIIDESMRINKISDGAFDVAINQLVELWKFDADSVPEIPDADQLAYLVERSGSDKIIVKNDSLKFLTEEADLGFGAIAKGMAVDSASQYLVSKGLNNFIIEAGGDLKISDGAIRTIGVQHPRERNQLIDTLKVKNSSIATSGDYEKYFISDGVRYCHIINPKIGMSSSDLISVTILSDKAYLSDSYATAVFVLGLDKGREFIVKNNLKGILCFLDEESNVVKEYVNYD